jgi:membrane-associated protease RseP (regulator of RpoE activity)
MVPFLFIGDPSTERWAIGEVTPGSAAAQAGLREGDEIQSFDGTPVPSFDDFREVISDAPAGEVDLVVLRDGQQVTVPVSLSQRTKLIGTIGEDVDVVDNGQRLLVGEPYPDGEAAASGLEAGATLLAVNDVPVSTLDDVTDAAASSRAGVVVLRTQGEDGEPAEHRIDLGTQLDATEPAAFVGVGQTKILETTGVPGAVVGSARTFGEAVALSVGGVGRFLWPPNLIGFVSGALSGSVDENSTDTPTEPSTTPPPDSPRCSISRRAW